MKCMMNLDPRGSALGNGTLPMDYPTRVFLFCVHQRLFAVDFAIPRVHENGSVVGNCRDDAAIRRRVAAVVWIVHHARLGRAVASICCRHQGQIIFDALKKSLDSPMKCHGLEYGLGSFTRSAHVALSAKSYPWGFWKLRRSSRYWAVESERCLYATRATVSWPDDSSLVACSCLSVCV
jgi:hypothetical protein